MTKAVSWVIFHVRLTVQPCSRSVRCCVHGIPTLLESFREEMQLDLPESLVSGAHLLFALAGGMATASAGNGQDAEHESEGGPLLVAAV